MTLKTITGEEQFQVMRSNFSITPSNESYQLAYSADGKTEFTIWPETVPAGEQLMVINAGNALFWKLIGNNSTVNINL